MKNKVRYGIFVFVAAFFLLGIQKVDAKEIEVDRIENGSYVIGKYLFTKEYPTVSTKVYMLAAKSISSDQLEDMIIYYKDLNGIWIDASTGDAIQTPEAFVIEWEDMEEVLEEDNEQIMEDAMNIEGIADFDSTKGTPPEEYFEETTYQVYQEAVHNGAEEVYGEGELYSSIAEHVALITEKKERLLSRSSFEFLGTQLAELEMINEIDYDGVLEDFLLLKEKLPLFQTQYFLVDYASAKVLDSVIEEVEILKSKFIKKELGNALSNSEEILSEEAFLQPEAHILETENSSFKNTETPHFQSLEKVFPKDIKIE